MPTNCPVCAGEVLYEVVRKGTHNGCVSFTVTTYPETANDKIIDCWCSLCKIRLRWASNQSVLGHGG